MKSMIVKNLFAGLLFLLPFTVLAQASVAGDYTSQSPNEQGTLTTLKVSMKADGTFTVDFGADDKIDVTGKYTIEGDQITLEDSYCPNQKGVFKLAMTETVTTLTVVTDPCKRGGPEGKIVLTRAK
jgi:hypothetical protein